MILLCLASRMINGSQNYIWNSFLLEKFVRALIKVCKLARTPRKGKLIVHSSGKFRNINWFSRECYVELMIFEWKVWEMDKKKSKSFKGKGKRSTRTLRNIEENEKQFKKWDWAFLLNYAKNVASSTSVHGMRYLVMDHHSLIEKYLNSYNINFVK